MVGSRVFSVIADQGAAYPFIVLQEISNTKVAFMEGESGLADARIQISCWSTSCKDSQLIGDKVRLAISGFTGTMGTTTVQDCYFDTSRDVIDPSPELSSRRIFGCVQEYVIGFNETVPTFS